MDVLTSEAAAEAFDARYTAWARGLARNLDAACRIVRDTAQAGLVCRGERAEWEAP